MAPVRKKKTNNLDEEDNNSLPYLLRQMQEEFNDEIGRQILKIDECKPVIIAQGAEILYERIIVNLPEELLDMNLSEYCKRTSDRSFTICNQNDTLVEFKNLREKVTSGVATKKEILKYNSVKKLL